jgi:predicted enzyme related to lactoylglutathione lyase
MRFDGSRLRMRQAILIALIWAAALLPMAAASAATPFALPAIGDSATPEHHPGKIIWADLVTPDLVTAERFYAGLFGWQFQSVHAGSADYAVATLDGRPIGGLFQKAVPAGEKRQSAWLTFIAVPDAAAATKIAVAHGAKDLAPPKTYAGRGSQAVLTDPQGAVFAVLASTSGDSADYLAQPGEWIWSSLLTSDPARSADFYKTVFGYEVYDAPRDDDAEHVVLASDDYARAGIHSLAPGHRHPHWLNFIRVTNATQSAARAVELGGRILVEPHLDRHGGQVAVIADPLGAPLGLLEWTDTDSKTEPAQ